jgi:hypothetical protein
MMQKQDLDSGESELARKIALKVRERIIDSIAEDVPGFLQELDIDLTEVDEQRLERWLGVQFEGLEGTIVSNIVGVVQILSDN